MQLKTDEGVYIKLSALPAHTSLHTYFYYYLLPIQTWRTPRATWSHEGIICTGTLVRKSIITLYLELMLVIFHLSQPQRSIVPLHNGEYNIHLVSCQCNTKTWILLLVGCYVLMKQQLSSSTVPCATVPCATVQCATYEAATVKFNSAMCHSAMYACSIPQHQLKYVIWHRTSYQVDTKKYTCSYEHYVLYLKSSSAGQFPLL